MPYGIGYHLTVSIFLYRRSRPFLPVGQRNFSIFNIQYSLFNSEALWASRLHSPLCLPTSTCSLVFALCCVKTIEQGKGEFVL